MSEGNADKAWRRAAAARERAAAAGAAADRMELLARQSGSEMFQELAARQREARARHLAAAELQETYARQVDAWSLRRQQDRPRPPFVRGVAAACGASGGALVMLDAERRQLAVTSSDARAAQVQEVEYVLGEGPVGEAAVSGRAVAAAGPELAQRWPNYARGVFGLGVRAAAAVPLACAGTRLGVLAVFDEARLPPEADLTRIATALTTDVLLGPDGDPLLYGDIDVLDVVHQATGMLLAHGARTPADALALIKARAFRDGTSSADIARQVVDCGLRLTGEAP
ncbi:ANTAR domain-containing protein [Streptomyces sp. NPDC016845]|uniref:ANTAR domain-containing protein n=1 Tax=Streptomyces sp. NPDC016845 TaxID=3364972 RepID=UPI00379A5CEB